jgi:small subunit ribosomal protein S1
MSSKGFPQIDWQDSDEGFGDESKDVQTSEFADLLKSGASTAAPRQEIRIGAKVRGIIVRLSPESGDVMIDLGTKAPAILDKAELVNEDGTLKLKQGDTADFYIVSKSADEIGLSLEKTRSLKSMDDLQAAFRDRIPVKGKVSKLNKGGFEITIFGKTAFCPVSQIDIRYVDTPAEFLGQDLEFLIEKMEGTRNIVVSRAAILRQKAEQRLEELAKTPSDQLLEGTVRRLTDFGAFVDIGGVEGLVHVSQMSFGRVNRPSDILNLGDKVRVSIIKIDQTTSPAKISLSLKAGLVDPWQNINDELKIGETYRAKVTKLIKVGAIVEIKPGYEGLVHVSEMAWGKRIHDPASVVQVDDVIQVAIKDIDPIQRRISLTMKSKEDNPWHDIDKKFVAGQSVNANVIRLKSFGAIVELASGIEAMLPITALKKKFGEAFRKQASPGKPLEVRILSVDAAQQRILTTLPGLDQDEEAKSDYQEYLKSEGRSDEPARPKIGESNKGVGSFGALLQQSLNKFNQSGSN